MHANYRTLALCWLLTGATTLHAAAEPVLRVAVASNFKSALETIGAQFTRSSGIPLRISSASTGVLAAQIRNGAPFDVFFAADRERPQALAKHGLALTSPQCLVRGSLVLLGNIETASSAASNAASNAASLQAAAEAALYQTLANAQRVAVANPRSAPYGRAAQDVLDRVPYAGTGPRKVIRGSNVLQAQQFFATGAADVALVARSLNPQTGIRIPKDWHAPIEQYALINAKTPWPSQSQQLLRYLHTPAVQGALHERGYAPCS